MFCGTPDLYTTSCSSSLGAGWVSRGSAYLNCYAAGAIKIAPFALKPRTNGSGENG